MPATPEERKAQQRAYYHAHRDQKRLIARRAYHAHREECIARNKASRAAHLEERREKDRLYNATHLEERRAYQRTYRTANKEKLRAKNARYHAAHRAEKLANTRAYYALHKERLNALKRAQPERVLEAAKRRRAKLKGAPVNDLTMAQWREIIAAYEHRCVYCGRTMQRLTQDHIIPLAKGGSHTASNVVPACMSCNTRKKDGPPPTPVQPLLLTVAPAKKKR